MEPPILDFLRRLEHVADEFHELRDGFARAVRIAGEDPEMALTRVRKVLEYVVRDVYQRRVGEPPGTRPLENLLQRLVKDGHFPHRLDAYAAAVRTFGNVGTHTFGERITARDVAQSLGQLSPILEWYFEAERPEALGPQPAPELHAAPLGPPPSGRITVLFTDVVDSTRMTRALGDAAYHRAMREPHCQRIRAALAAHRGHEVKTIGDSFMVAFPSADDALACAAAILKSLTAPPITAVDPQGKDWTVEVRIGVHTAERELTPHPEAGRFDYTGTDVNFAARVEALADGGQVVVSAATHTAAADRERYSWKEWPGRRLKSFDRPETVWELLWDGRSRGEPGARWLPDWYVGERSRYIARPALQDAILRTFAAPQPDGTTPRLVTLHGAGGMGKTRLAVACAAQAAGLFADGVFFVRLEDRPRTREAVAEAIGAALGQTGEAAQPERLVAKLRDLEVLLILDNYESVDCDEVADYLAALLVRTRTPRFLLTGREAAKLSDVEQRFSLEEGMAEAEAEELFVARARLKKRGWQPDDAERKALQDILGLTERSPLGIEFAAAWTDRYTLAEIAAGLRATPLGEMAGEQPRSRRATQAERHQSLARCLDWSYGLLEEGARQGFACLGVFADSFEVEAVAAVTDLPDARAVLHRLQDAALIRRIEVAGRSRFSLHRFTRAYTAQKLSALPAAASVRQRFIAHYRRLMADHSEGGNLAHLAVLDAEWQNAVAAAEVAEEATDWTAVREIADVIEPHLGLRGMWSEWEQLNDRALAAVRAANDPPAEGRVLNRLGHIYLVQGQWAEAEAVYQQSLAIMRECGDRLGEGRTLGSLGHVYRVRGRWAEAEAACQEDLTICREFGNRVGEGQTLNNLGLVYEAQGRWAEAEAAYQQDLAICREFNDRLGEGTPLMNLGNVYRVQSRWAEAEAAHQQSLAICREFGDRLGEGQTLDNLGLIYEAQGRWAEAEAASQQSLALFREFGDRLSEGMALNNLGNVYQAQGRWAEAEAAYHQSRAIFREFGDRLNESRTLNNLGDLYEAQGRWTEAEAAYQQDLSVCREFGDRVGEGQTLESLALLREAQGDLPGALAIGRTALAVLEQTEDEMAKARAKALLAKWQEPA